VTGCGKKFAQLVLIILNHVTSHKANELLGTGSHVTFLFYIGLYTN
jgi:hypothetical protein